MRIEDKILFNEIRKGNKLVYESLFNEYYEHFVQFANNYLFDQQASEDIVQDLYVHVWENAKKLNIHSSIKSYFYQALKNRCLNYLKRLRLKDDKDILYVEALLSARDDTTFYDPEILNQVKAAINLLPQQMSKIMYMKYIDGLKQMEIAEELNISVNTVKTQLKRAKDKIRKSLFNATGLMFML